MPFDSGAKGSVQTELSQRARRSAGFRWFFVMQAARAERLLRELPRPEPIFERVPNPDKESPIKWNMARWKPSVHTLLDPLHGYRRSVLPEAQWRVINGEKFPRYEVVRPPMAERIERFRKALGIVHEFSAWEDLIPLTVYRRQVSNGGGLIEIDMQLYLLVVKAAATDYFRPVEVKYLAERMPPCSAIRGMLYRLAARELKRLIHLKLGSVTL